MIPCCFFKGSCFVLTFYVILFFVFLLFRWLSFSQKSNYFWFGFVLRFFGVLLFLFYTW